MAPSRFDAALEAVRSPASGFDPRLRDDLSVARVQLVIALLARSEPAQDPNLTRVARECRVSRHTVTRVVGQAKAPFSEWTKAAGRPKLEDLAAGFDAFMAGTALRLAWSDRDTLAAHRELVGDGYRRPGRPRKEARP